MSIKRQPAARLTVRGAGRCRVLEVQSFFTKTLLLAELHRSRVHAVTQPGLLRPVVEDMSEMGIAAGAEHFGPFREQRIVRTLKDIFRSYRLPETRPAGSRLVLVFRAEQVVAAADAAVDPLLVVVPGRAAKG